ncbi:hypothetical protein CYK93_00420 [Clostridium perfringens]|uniref:hemolysin XhlA family protein n=1 Tax=Clostridium perfringens TaxID=1502 RepID=UPI000D7147E1|nr:hemolysin XhlA family protein [Clostridium perfringens]PWX33379.1 hypothetical protein CYK93_00420 [Clostridium perfringens]PWX60007.1 hypothetical protein CYK86_00420 [Clostridium perfringens]
MNDELMEHRINKVEEKTEEHDKRIDKIEQGQAEFKIEIKNLCDSIKGLTTALKWGLCFLITTFVGFFFYAIQNHLFK